ncbi:hypothetical protein F4821DRAFT_266170 [Hypoxylon rubiginosum]|uniref:Uncharacterized protein n=1 Tax=Hypoxylon rubiginosum TaxID=110542 RepID=A0ACC0CIH3_9PEZI|nr:hypothetical protein F4821DRAFT_266170 [Hypoxylon rubiginosum]
MWSEEQVHELIAKLIRGDANGYTMQHLLRNLDSDGNKDLWLRVIESPTYTNILRIIDSKRPLNITRRLPARLSLGLLDVLPNEVLAIVCGNLDFQSLSRFSRVCLGGKALVESLPVYRDILNHVPSVVLSQTNSDHLGGPRVETSQNQSRINHRFPDSIDLYDLCDLGQDQPD